MKKILALSIISIFLFSCGGDQNSNNGNSLSGNLANLEEGIAVYLDYLTPNQIVTKDTASIDGNGNYSFDYSIDEIGYYRLRINNQNFINLILNKGETPVINGDGKNLMDTYTVEGSPQSQSLKDFNMEIKKDFVYQDSLNQVYVASQNNPQVYMDVAQKSIASETKLKMYFMNMANENSSNLVGLAAVQQLDIDQHYDIYKKVDEAISKTLSGTPYYEAFHKEVEKRSKINIGGEAPDFSVNDKDGNPIKLSDLRGSVVLVDFWASWCKPCRAENPNVVKAYNQYKDKGFDVFSVSLDGMPQQPDSRGAWLAAIEKDGLIWKNHGSELKGWQSSFVQLYGIQGIPFTLLIDKEGKIIGKNLRGEELHQKLAEILG